MKNFLKTFSLLLIVNFFTVGLVWGKKPPTIEEAIQIALKNNSTLKSCSESYRASKSSAFGAWSNFLPRADASLGRGGFDNPRQFFTYEPPYLLLSGSAFNFGLAVNQTIFDGGFSRFMLW